MNALWVQQKESVPPIIFTDALREMEGSIPGHIVDWLYETIRIKSQGKEKDIIDNVEEVDTFIEQFLGDTRNIPRQKSYPPLDILNEELQRILLCSPDG
jgi:hypothetical protein